MYAEVKAGEEEEVVGAKLKAGEEEEVVGAMGRRLKHKLKCNL